jgi:uncharacterized membrane protein
MPVLSMEISTMLFSYMIVMSSVTRSLKLNYILSWIFLYLKFWNDTFKRSSQKLSFSQSKKSKKRRGHKKFTREITLGT